MRLRTWGNVDDVETGSGVSIRRIVVKCGEERELGTDAWSNEFRGTMSHALSFFGYPEEVVLCWEGQGKVERREDGRELELEKHFMTERYQMRRLGWGGMPVVNWGNMPVLRIPRIVSLTVAVGEGEKGLEEKIFWMEQLG
jgi:hypothetical protein